MNTFAIGEVVQRDTTDAKSNIWTSARMIGPDTYVALSSMASEENPDVWPWIRLHGTDAP